MALLERLHRAKAELSEGENDPWRRMLERVLPPNVTCTSTVALLGLLDFPATTGNARRLARTMKSDGLGRDQIAAPRAGRVAHHRVPWVGATV